MGGVTSLWYQMKCDPSGSADGLSSGITNSPIVLRDISVPQGKTCFFAELEYFMVVLFTSHSSAVKLCLIITTFVTWGLLLKAFGYILCCIVVRLALLLQCFIKMKCSKLRSHVKQSSRTASKKVSAAFFCLHGRNDLTCERLLCFCGNPNSLSCERRWWLE